MLACARLGAVHSVVFGGFAAQELARRIEHAEVSEQNFMLMGFYYSRTLPYGHLVITVTFLSWKKLYVPIFGKKKEEMAEGRRAGWASKLKWDPLLSSKSGSATG